MNKSDLIKQLENLPDVPIEFTKFNYENGDTIETFNPASVDGKNVLTQRNKEGKTVKLIFLLE